ncbi:cytochrome c oxidase subunit 3 [Fulvivirgaceae bacterium BMA12]|uniref:Cytochrome c oxidase subunit 3 n=1 Tax=Agaribacillus aureus TaxID=3051825 RepID=A0ABT8L059_9BACT|nr:cytochrome c oxidase subunit 3 [Fulvivirgaceae bacterium BMA12]
MEHNIESRDRIVQPLSMHPKKFALWLFIISVVMIFAAMTSAYIVRRGEGNWLDFSLPDIFWVNTIIIFLSSISMHIAYRAAKKDNLNTLRVAMVITTVLGAAFLIGQYLSWDQLKAQSVIFSDPGTPAGSFVYVFTGLHGFHLVTGLVFLVIVLIAAFRYKVHSRNMVQIEMCATYWHFLDGLWIYLFLFLLMNH